MPVLCPCLLKNKNVDLILQEREVFFFSFLLFLALVPLHVEGQVIRAGETAVAHAALERLRPRVFPEMASQLIRTGEAPLTSLPGALVRLLSFSQATGEKKKRKQPNEATADKTTHIWTRFPLNK